MMIRKLSTYFICFSSLISMGLNAVVLTVNSNSDAAFATGGTGVGTTGDLRYVLNYINQNPNTYQVQFTLGGGSETIVLQGLLPVLNLNAANNLTIDGSNTTGSGTKISVSGSNTQRGFIAQQGLITIQNMNIQNTNALGGNGGLSSGGGGMGAGGGLLVNQAQVSISNVNFSNNNATGGSGANLSGTTGGGGGMGGNGGALGASGGGGLGGAGGSDITATFPAGGGGIGPGGGGGVNGGVGTAGGGFGAASGGPSANGTLGGINAGGGGSGAVVNNGGGGGGVDGSAGTLIAGGNGGFGGGGGGIGGGGTGGNGGFGGGGGAAGGAGGFGGGGAAGGNGGFGGGGGGSTGTPGTGGVAGGQGAANGGGGGGAGLGGDIFVNSAAGGTLTVLGPMTTSASNTFAGTGGNNGTNGAAAGNAIFALAGAPLNFSPASFDVVTINGSIGDDSSNTLPGTGSSTGYTPGTSAGTELLKDREGELQLLSDNTYSGTTTLENGILTIDRNTSLGKSGVELDVTGESTLKTVASFESDRPINLEDDLTFDTDVNTVVWTGIISGDGELEKRGTGTLHLKGPNDYSGGTRVSVGTLKGDTSSLQGLITNNATLEFSQNFEGVFNGSLAGNGITEKTGFGRVHFINDSLLYTGRTNVRQGEIALSAALGGDVFIFEGGRFSDNGRVLGNITVDAGLLTGQGRVDGNVTVRNRGRISPGLGTFRIDGFYVQQAGSIYTAIFNRAGDHSKLLIGETATINPGSTLELAATDGFVVNKLHTIIETNEGVIGVYDDVIVLNEFFNAEVVYDEDNVYVSFREDFTKIAQGCNQAPIAAQLMGFGVDLTPDIQSVFQEFTLLDVNETRRALDQISGAQYASVILTADLANRQFTRRIFDPVRQIIATNPCAPHVYCSFRETFDVWGSVSGGQAFFQGNHCVSGFNISDVEFTFGLHTRYSRDVTFGAAFTVENGWMSYNIGGSGKNCTVLGGVYALYRPKSFYIFGDFNIGANSNKIRRTVDIASMHFRPKATVNGYQTAVYAEVGTDFGSNFVLFQPFVALEIGTCQLNKFSDSDSANNYPFAVRVNGQSFTNASTRLGVHLTSAPLKSGWSMAMDFSWNYRFGSINNSIQQRFKNLGDTFTVRGVPFQHNALEATVMFNQNINKCWDIYFEGNGYGWSHSFAYSITGGLLYTW